MRMHTDSRRAPRLLRRTAPLLGMAVLAFVYAGPALGTPMRCSSEQTACITSCNKSPNRASIPTCITNCGSRRAYCMKTGCWLGNTQKYCGLLKQ